MAARYSAPLADLRFVLYDVLDAESLLARLPGYENATRDVLDAVLDESAKFTEQVLAPLNQVGDQEGCHFDAAGASVTSPRGFKQAYQQYVDNGWSSLTASAAYGGQEMPQLLGAAVKEMLDSANLAWGNYPLLSHGATEALLRHGEEWQREAFLKPIIAGRWTGTMCLTEAHCGTDLGLLKTRAEPADDGAYRISGTKIFITAGEHDFTENIVHLVLARLPDAPAGVKGISLFIVPKFKVDRDGRIGERNSLACGAIEHKMGIKGSSTCVMNFDGSRGWLIGEINGGLRNMFTMMNHARLWVGLQGLAQCERGWQASIAYARERRQGRTSAGDKAPADPIIGHPDVRRMLLTQKALIEGARVLIWYAGQQMDRSLHHPDAKAKDDAGAVLSVLTPIVKGFVTGMSLECTSEAIQVHGGHGYVRETGVEQFFRDARITMIYEGANGIQALDLLGRKVLGSGGTLARRLGGLIGGFCERHAGSGEHAELVARLAGLLKEWSVATEEVARHG